MFRKFEREVLMWKYWLMQNYQFAKAYIDWIRGAPKLHRRFFRNHGYQLNLENPQTFSEKVQWRKLYDKNSIFSALSNKYLVREYIADRLGHDRAQELLVPLLQYSKDPDRIYFEALPAQFVLKATHGSGMNLIVEDRSKLDHAATRALMKRWLNTHYGLRDHEWNYTKTEKGILAETFIANSDKLIDIRLYFFDGKMQFFSTRKARGESFAFAFFNADKKRLNVGYQGKQVDMEVVPISNLDEMVELGKILAEQMDFVRVDFLCTPERFYIGELTQHPNSGSVPFDPQSFDKVLGSYWSLPEKSKIS